MQAGEECMSVLVVKLGPFTQLLACLCHTNHREQSKWRLATQHVCTGRYLGAVTAVG